jgi:hypothetical protein
MQLSVGEDIFSTLTAVGLISLFVVVLAHFYRGQEESLAHQEDFELTLEVIERLKNDVISSDQGGVRPSLIYRSAFERELPRFSELLLKQGIGLRVEVRAIDGELILSHGGEPEGSQCSISLPVTLGRAAGKRELSELVVWVWRS